MGREWWVERGSDGGRRAKPQTTMAGCLAKPPNKMPYAPPVALLLRACEQRLVERVAHTRRLAATVVLRSTARHGTHRGEWRCDPAGCGGARRSVEPCRLQVAGCS